MKYLSVFALLAIMFMVSCKSEDSAAKNDARNSLNVPENVAPVTPPVQPSSGGIVHHYICSNNCEGSGGPSAGNCPVCGNAYVHNQAWHNQPANNTAQSQPTASGQNAAGVWHYICSNGCAGGSGTQGACATCGSALAHNAAYHN